MNWKRKKVNTYYKQLLVTQGVPHYIRTDYEFGPYTQYTKLLYRINKHSVAMKTLQNKRAPISVTFVLLHTVFRLVQNSIMILFCMLVWVYLSIVISYFKFNCCA